MFKTKKEAKVNKGKLLSLGFVQLSAIGLLFLFVFKQELVVVVKDVIQNLPIGSRFVEQMAMRGYIVFNALSNSPSIVAICIVVLQVLLFTTSFKIIALLIAKPSLYEEGEIALSEHKTYTFRQNHRESYLENLRLLF